MMEPYRYALKHERTFLMGILNITPDSFSDGGLYMDPSKAVSHAERLIREGADIIDVGGESSRPGATPVPVDVELERVLPIVKTLCEQMDTPVSVDTYKSKVAAECLKAGASIINDITGMASDDMAKVAAEYDACVVIMHMRGTPETMQECTAYDDVVSEIVDYLKGRIEKAEKFGVGKIIIDPGIGFGKTVEQNLEILGRLDEFKTLGYPLLVGTSRKSFIRKTLGTDESNRILAGTIASVCASAIKGADIVRVHDVRECRAALDIMGAIIKTSY